MTKQIFWVFLKLGCISFGGPMAHISYFYRTFVTHLEWLDDPKFNQLNAMCSLLPGPSSSQLGFAIGYCRAGIWGGIAAFLGFTLPSFIVMVTAALGLLSLNGEWNIWQYFIDAMKLFAVVVVADASASMFSQLCKYQWQQILAFAATISLLIGFETSAVIVLCGFFGILLSTEQSPTTPIKSHQIKRRYAFLFISCLLLTAIWNDHLFSQFYFIGSSVFGGGHVVLPLLQEFYADQIDSATLLSGYAMAQAIPGPMFSIASFLGAVMSPQHPIFGAFIATLGIFAPGFLMVMALLNFWQTIQSSILFTKITQGLYSAMVALLLSSLFEYIVSSSISSFTDIAIVGIAAITLVILPRGLVWAAIIVILGQGL